jgi:hypothetical protein
MHPQQVKGAPKCLIMIAPEIFVERDQAIPCRGEFSRTSGVGSVEKGNAGGFGNRLRLLPLRP